MSPTDTDEHQKLLEMCEMIGRLFPKRSRYVDVLEEKFPEILEKDHRIYLYHPLPYGEKREEWSEDWHAVQIARRMLALFEHFSIKPDEPDAFALLAMALAEKRVPAFKVNTLRDAKARENWDDFVYFLEIRWLMQENRIPEPLNALRLWLTLKGYDASDTQFEQQVSTHKTKYYDVRRKNRILADLRNSLNSKARGQSRDYVTSVDEIPESKLDEHLFQAFPKALEHIRQVLKSA